MCPFSRSLGPKNALHMTHCVIFAPRYHFTALLLTSRFQSHTGLLHESPYTTDLGPNSRSYTTDLGSKNRPYTMDIHSEFLIWRAPPPGHTPLG